MNIAGGLMKKWLKRIVKLFVIVVLLLILLDLGVHLLARTQWFDTRVEKALTGALGREVELGPMHANLSGLIIEGISIAEQGGFKNGTFVQAGQLRVRFSLIHLLHGHLLVNGLTLSQVNIQLTVHPDGTPNWADLTASSASAQSAPSTSPSAPAVDITAHHVRLEDLHLTYMDKQTQRTLDISSLTLNVKHFNFTREFPVQLVAKFLHQEPAFTRNLLLTLKARVNLAALDWPHTYAQIESLKAYYQKSSVVLSGRLTNLTSPRADLKMTVHHLSADMLPHLPQGLVFDLPRADASVQAALDNAQQTLTLERLTLQAPGVDMQAQGRLNYGSSLTYDAAMQANFVLGEMGRWLTSLAEPYRFVGEIRSTVSATQQQARAQVNFEEIGALIPNAGRVANVNGQVTMTENMDFKAGNADVNVAGKLNASPFKLSFQAQQTPQKITAALDVYAKEVILPALQQTAPEQAPAVAAEAATPSAWPLPPVDLTAKVQLEQLDVPYFLGKDILFTSNVAGLTPNLDQAHGTLRLTTGAGTIQDIYKLTDANPLTKVLFLSLNVTGKVFNSLNVLGVLNSIGSGVVSVVSGGEDEEEKPVKTQTILGPDGEPLEVVVEETTKEVSGEMQYDKFDTEVNFTHGLATIEEGTFVSPMMSFRLDGTADFNSGALDMMVHAAPGRHEVDGMMPLSLKIGGTVEEPQGDMQLLGSVTSLVTQSVTNNVVSRNVTKGIKGIFGLFKKKEKPQEQTSLPATSPNID